MNKLLAYALVSAGTVWLAYAEANEHMGISGFLAIFVCQPWLGVIWTLTALGFPIPDRSLSPDLIALFVSLNTVIWRGWLLARDRRQRADKSGPPSRAS